MEQENDDQIGLLAGKVSALRGIAVQVRLRHSPFCRCSLPHRRVSALCSPSAQNLRPWPTFAATAPARSRTPPSHQIGDHVREDNKMLDGLDDRCAEERQIGRRGTLRPPAGRPYLG